MGYPIRAGLVIFIFGILVMGGMVSILAEAVSPFFQNETEQSEEKILSPDATSLEKQLELMRKHQSDLLGTVHWALSIAIGVVILVVGLNWYTSSTTHARDMQAIRDHVELQIAQSTTKTRDDLRADYEKHSKELQKMESSVEDGLEKMKKDLASLAKAEIEGLENRFKGMITELRWDHQHLHIEFLKETKAPSAYLLVHQIKYLEACVERGFEKFAGNALQDIRKLIRGGTDVDPFVLPDLDRIISKLPEQYETEVKALRDEIAKARG